MKDSAYFAAVWFNSVSGVFLTSLSNQGLSDLRVSRWYLWLIVTIIVAAVIAAIVIIIATTTNVAHIFLQRCLFSPSSSNRVSYLLSPCPVNSLLTERLCCASTQWSVSISPNSVSVGSVLGLLQLYFLLCISIMPTSPLAFLIKKIWLIL
jgi:hypothetical protein